MAEKLLKDEAVEPVIFVKKSWEKERFGKERTPRQLTKRNSKEKNLLKDEAVEPVISIKVNTTQLLAPPGYAGYPGTRVPVCTCAYRCTGMPRYLAGVSGYPGTQACTRYPGMHTRPDSPWYPGTRVGIPTPEFVTRNSYHHYYSVITVKGIRQLWQSGLVVNFWTQKLCWVPRVLGYPPCDTSLPA
eukprot:2297675-Rhodomonas_salina.1